MRNAVIVIGTSVAVLLLGVFLVDEGPVVELHTFDAEGGGHWTPVWWVEGEDGTLRIGAHLTHPGWLERLEANPEVELLQEDDRVLPFRGEHEPDPSQRAAFRRAIREKYGLAARIAALWTDEERAVVLRLHPDPTREARTRESPHAGPS